jgi:hypothetical protein
MDPVLGISGDADDAEAESGGVMGSNGNGGGPLTRRQIQPFEHPRQSVTMGHEQPPTVRRPLHDDLMRSPGVRDTGGRRANYIERGVRTQ